MFDRGKSKRFGSRQYGYGKVSLSTRLLFGSTDVEYSSFFSYVQLLTCLVFEYSVAETGDVVSF